MLDPYNSLDMPEVMIQATKSLVTRQIKDYLPQRTQPVCYSKPEASTRSIEHCNDRQNC
jgi:hypothetical protein